LIAIAAPWLLLNRSVRLSLSEKRGGGKKKRCPQGKRKEEGGGGKNTLWAGLCVVRAVFEDLEEKGREKKFGRGEERGDLLIAR